MKNSVFLFVVLIFVGSGCRTIRPEAPVVQRVESDITASRETDVVAKSTTSVTETEKLQLESMSDVSKTSESREVKKTTIETKIVDFDTSKPPEPNTGKSPVLRETTVTEHEISESFSNVLETVFTELKAEQANNRDLRGQLDVQSVEINKLRQELNTQVRTGLAGWQKTLMYCGGAFILLFLIAIYKKIKPFI